MPDVARKSAPAAHAVPRSSGQRTTPPRLAPRRHRRRSIAPVAFVTPLLALLAVFMFFPIVSAIDLSFRNAKTFSSTNASFVGLENYRSLIADPDFGALVRHSFIRGLGGAIPSYLLGLAAALALNSRRRGIAGFRVIALIPFVLSTPVAVSTWLQLLDPDFGFLGSRFGSGNNLLANPQTVWPTLLTINTWFSFQFYTILLLAALQQISPELYEAAQVDGAGAVGRFVHVTMPGLARVSLVFLGIHFMLSFQEVNLIFIATGGGPANATQTIATYAYATGFRSFRIGFAAAASIVSFLLMFAALAAFALLAYGVVRLRRAAKSAVAHHVFAASKLVRPATTYMRSRRHDARDRRRRFRLTPRVCRVLSYLPPSLVALLGVAPLLLLLSQSFDGTPSGSQKMTLFPRRPTIDNYTQVLSNPQLRDSTSGGDPPPLFFNFVNSVFVAAVSTVLVLVVAGTAGYGLSRARGQWPKLATGIILVVQFVPPVLLVFPLYHELSLLNLLNSRIGLAIVTGVLVMPLATLLFKTFFDSSSRQLEEAAALDGASAFRTFRSVVIPTSRPVMGAVAAFALISSWNEFLFSITFISDAPSRTLPSSLYLLTSTQSYAAFTSPGQQAVYLVAPALLAVVLLAFTQRHFTAAFQGGGVKE